jgi:hypothetical protein
VIYYPSDVKQILYYGDYYVEFKTKTIRVLIVEPGKAPSPANIPAGLGIITESGRNGRKTSSVVYLQIGL